MRLGRDSLSSMAGVCGERPLLRVGTGFFQLCHLNAGHDARHQSLFVCLMNKGEKEKVNSPAHKRKQAQRHDFGSCKKKHSLSL